jgi:signal transduction histidine kinase
MEVSSTRAFLLEGELGEALAATRRSVRAPRSRDAQLIHDLKNVHTCILGNARILQREVGEAEFLRRRVDALIRAAATAIGLIHRLDAGAEDAQDERRPLDLSTLVCEAEPLLRGVVPERVDLRIDVAPAPAVVAACADSIRRILLELVVNAVEAIGEARGRVEVQTGCATLGAAEIVELDAMGGIAPGPHAWLEVRDDGAGIDAVTRRRLFEHGFSTKGPGRGRGLGLVRETLARYRAGLLVRSRRAQGSAFRIFLPATR